MTPITAKFPTVNFPKRGELERDAFVQAQENAQDVLSDTWNTAATDFKNQTNTLATELNNLVEGQTSTQIHIATEKTTPADNDELGLVDSASSWGLKKLTWANLKTALGSLFVSKITSTANKLVKFSNTSSGLADSVIYDDGVNVGVGVIPSAWGSQIKAITGNADCGIAFNTSVPAFYSMSNTYFNGTNWIYKKSAYATYYTQYNGSHTWYTAPSGTAGNPITWTTAMELGANGNLLVGTTTDNGVDKLQVNGSISASSFSTSVAVVSVPGSTATTILDLASYQRKFLTVKVTDSGTRIGCAGTVLVLYDGGQYNVSLSQQHTGLYGSTLSISGTSLQFTHTYGSTRNVTITVMAI